MRLWTVHPQYLDSKGLVASWREALLAQKVLMGETRGYQNHPQLARFKAQNDPVSAIATFLTGIAEEAQHRGYRFDTTKILKRRLHVPLLETDGQLLYEWEHLKRKLQVRAPKLYNTFQDIAIPKAHPLFRITAGDVREWEKR